jgi:Fe-S-cluster formation regulator IscX/YfhJ
MENKLIPLPESDLLPLGWAKDVVEPWLNDNRDDGEIMDGYAYLSGIAEVYKIRGKDALELVKGLRLIEIKIGQVLGDPTKEKDPDTGKFTVLHQCNMDLSKYDRARFRKLANLEETIRPIIYKAKDSDEITRKALLALSLGGLKSTTGNVWYTPEIYVNAAREVMGSIDLDPATDEEGNKIIKAKNIITEDDEPDGLNQDWHGNIWLNPPYGKGSGLFTSKLIREYDKRVTQAVLLLNAYGFDSLWFQPLWQFPICFTDHRIKFTNPNRDSGGPANANIFIYLGDKREKFKDIFSEFGHVVKLWE